MNATIEFKDLHRTYGDRAVLQGLEFFVMPGEVYALLGRNGAGKTTALRILLGFLDAMRGEAKVLGVEGRKLGPDERERIGLITEGQKLYDYRSVGDTLLFEQGTRRRFDIKYVDMLLSRLEISKDQTVSKLSRGQRSQLALALALAGHPDVLVFDDPAMGLDVVARRNLMDAMIDLLSESGSSVLFSSHILPDVERVADRVGVLHGGRLVLDADMDAIRGRFERRFLRRPPHGSAIHRPTGDSIVAWNERSDGVEVCLLDPSREFLAQLERDGARLSSPEPTGLEDLFIHLTTRDSDPGDLRPGNAGIQKTELESDEVVA